MNKSLSKDRAGLQPATGQTSKGANAMNDMTNKEHNPEPNPDKEIRTVTPIEPRNSRRADDLLSSDLGQEVQVRFCCRVKQTVGNEQQAFGMNKDVLSFSMFIDDDGKHMLWFTETDDRVHFVVETDGGWNARPILEDIPMSDVRTATDESTIELHPQPIAIGFELTRK
jgi:hypothetical protein